MLECTPCGSAIPPGHSVCPACGAPIPKVDAPDFDRAADEFLYDDEDDDEIRPIDLSRLGDIEIHTSYGIDDTSEMDEQDPPSLQSEFLEEEAEAEGEATVAEFIDPFADEPGVDAGATEPAAPVPPPPPAPRASTPRSAPLGGEKKAARSPSRWYPLLDQSPVFSQSGEDGADDLRVVNPMPVMQPVGLRPADIEVAIEPRYEFNSVPASTDSAFNVLVRLRPNGPSLVDPSTGPVAHQILALDLSASMNHPDKYPVLTQALAGMLEDLHAPGSADVLLSVVLFAYGSQSLLKRVPASQLDVRDLLDRIDHSPLRFGRYTDIVGALGRSGNIALAQHRDDKTLPVRINVLTDGRPQDMDGARRMMKKIARLPVDVDGLCFGADADVAGMKSLFCGNKGGTVKQVRSDTIGEAFGRIAEVAQHVVAKKSVLDVELRPGVVGGAAYRFRPGRHAFGRNAFQGGRHFHTELGTLESGREYAMLFQVRLPKTQQTESEIGRLTLRVPGFGGPRVFEALLSVPRHPGDKEPAPDAVVVEAREILEAMDKDDPQAKLKALRARRKLYQSERRDPYIIELIDKAIAEIEEQGNLDALSRAEQAALLAHTCTVGLGGPGRA